MEPHELELIETSTNRDSVRAYLQKMGKRELLTRDEEVAICQKVEEGERRVFLAILGSPIAASELRARVADVRKGKAKIEDLVRDSDDEDFDARAATRRVFRAAEKVRALRAEGACAEAIAEQFVEMKLSKKFFDRIILKLRTLIAPIEAAERASVAGSPA